MNTNSMEAMLLLKAEEKEQFNMLLEVATDSILNKLENDQGATLNPGIMGGEAGAILFLFHMARFSDDEALLEKAMLLLEHLLDSETDEALHSLFSGLPGMVWLLLYLQREGFIDRDESLISEELLDSICNTSLQQVRAGHYDYMHNGLSVAVALLCSIDQVHSRVEYFTKVVAALDATALQYGDDAIYWEYLYTETPGKGISMGLSHGLPSVISFLSKLCNTGIATEQCQLLIRKAVRFMQLHADTGRQDWNYPSLVHPGAKPPYDPTRLGWCYGDMGITISLIHAANAIGDIEYRNEAKRLISVIQKRDDNHRCMQHDATFCHGTWGIAHLFMRFNQYSPDPELVTQAKYWLRQSLELTRVSEEKMEIMVSEYGNANWSGNVDVLNGIAGVGLVLLSVLSAERLHWDEIFLIDIN